MCIWVPDDHPNRDALIAFAIAQGKLMAAALEKWTDQDWAVLEAPDAEDDLAAASAS